MADRQEIGVDALPITDDAKERLRGHLENFASALLRAFPGYDFESTELARMSREAAPAEAA